MAHFPFFTELSGRTGLIVGGGRTALGKARRLADYGPALTVVAPEVLPELESVPCVTVLRRRFERDDLHAELAFVIAATDDAALNREIACLCREMRVPVNVVDAPEDCSFLFPSLVRRGPLSIGISTGGASPTAAIAVKNAIDGALPENLGEILLRLSECRDGVKRRVPTEEARKRVFRRLFEESVRLGRPLTEDETGKIIRGEESIRV